MNKFKKIVMLAGLSSQALLWASEESSLKNANSLYEKRCTDYLFNLVRSTENPQNERHYIRTLLKAANVDATETWSTRPEWKPLHWAAYNGHHEFCTDLIEHKAKIDDSSSDGRTPLHLAAMEGRTAACAVLLAHGAAINALDIEKNAPIHYALKCKIGGRNSEECAQLLLSNGCIVNVPDKDGHLPLVYASAMAMDRELCTQLIPITIFVPQEKESESVARKAIITALFCIKHLDFPKDIKSYILRILIDETVHDEFILSILNHLRRRLELGETCKQLPVSLHRSLHQWLLKENLDNLSKTIYLTLVMKLDDVSKPFAQAIDANIARFLGAPEPQVEKVEDITEIEETL